MERRIIKLPYSACSYGIDEKSLGVAFHEINTPVVSRQKRINQLQRLTYPSDDDCEDDKLGYFWFPFSHSRFDHALNMVATLKIILQWHGYSEQFINQIVLIVLSHDMFMPGGGDATIRIDREKFCEVSNYERRMLESEICTDWVKYGFDVSWASSVVAGLGQYGFLVNFFDRWSYTFLDAFNLGKRAPQAARNILRKNYKLGDIWQDVRITKQSIHFASPARLFNFLHLRALMHSEFYLNPACRKLEHLFASETRKMFEAGKISSNDLMHKDDAWLDQKVKEDKIQSWCVFPGDISFEKFASELEAENFFRSNPRAFYLEYIKKFKTSSHWMVSGKGKIMPLHDALPIRYMDELEKLSNLRVGWYVYCHK